MMDDLISRQAAIDALRGERHGLVEFMDYCLKNEMYGSRYHAKLERNRIDEDILILENLPAAETLTDKEQRIFLSAMKRERDICVEIDKIMTREPYEDNLAWICDEIERKVKGALWTI